MLPSAKKERLERVATELARLQKEASRADEGMLAFAIAEA